MRSVLLLLLVLSLITGFEASSDECREGWAEFTCRYIQTHEGSNFGDLLQHEAEKIQITVVTKQHKYKCSRERDDSDEDGDDCQTPLTQTAYRTVETTITCDPPGNKYKSSDRFFCKDGGSVCEDILSVESNKTFTVTESSSGFSVSISNVSSDDAGVYWCGLKRDGGGERAALRQIKLEVKDIRNFTRSPTAGETLKYWCGYPNGVYSYKFICKGEDPSMCKPLVSTEPRNNDNGKFSLTDDRVKRNISVTVRGVTAEDTGIYWCGAENRDVTRSFFHRLNMTVVLPPTPTPSIISSTSSLHPSAESDGVSLLTVILPVVACVAVLLLVLLVLVYKRLEISRKSRKGEAQNHKEDRAYEEIQERPPKPDSGSALQTVYATADFPSAPHHYTYITFNSSSGAVNGDTHSTVTDNGQSPTYSTVNHPSGSSEDPFYSTVKNPQQL